jgi:arginine decarboxylase
VASRDPRTHELFNRTFYRLNEEAEVHATVLAGVRRRYDTPFFDALRRYAAAPIGQFHALPVARGASIFNSRWLQDMGEFYGRATSSRPRRPPPPAGWTPCWIRMAPSSRR